MQQLINRVMFERMRPNSTAKSELNCKNTILPLAAHYAAGQIPDKWINASAGVEK